MEQIVEFLQKTAHVEDQILVGLTRASNNIDLAIKIIQTLRAANLGKDSNAVLDALLPVAVKLQAITGKR